MIQNAVEPVEKPRILFLAQTDYEALERKGVARMVLERDEDGFFERVVTVHPLAARDRIVVLGPVHLIVEYSLGTTLLENTPPWLWMFMAPVRLSAVVARLVRLVRRERIQLIRATDAYLMGLLAWIVARLTRIPFCVSVHADYDKRFALTPKSGLRRVLRWLAAPLPSFVLRRADLVLPIREHLAEWAASKGARPGAIRVIPHGIDFAPFVQEPADVRSWTGIGPDARIVSFVGRLANDNYVSDMLEVARRLAARRCDFVLVMVGDGPAGDDVRHSLLADRALAARVRMLGFQPYERVVAIRQASSVALALMGGILPD